MTFDERWGTASAEFSGTDSNDPPEPGIYEAALIDADAFVSKAGEDWVKLTWRDVHSGYEWDVLYGFKSEKAANVTKATIATLGVVVEAVESFEELGLALKEKVGRYYTVEVKQSGTFRNTYIVGENEGAPPTDVPADTEGLDEAKAAVGADDVPWGE